MAEISRHNPNWLWTNYHMQYGNKSELLDEHLHAKKHLLH